MLRRAARLSALAAPCTLLGARRPLALSAETAVSDTRPAQLFSLEGKVALVTGGSGGLGKAIARGLALAGADVVITSRREPELRASLAEITDGTGVRGEYIVADLATPGEADRVGAEALRRFGHVDILVNNAGVSAPGTIHKGREEAIPNITDDSWRTTLSTNLTAAMELTNALAPSMVARGWGRIVHVSSIAAIGSSEGRSAYSASKAGMVGLTHCGALELGPCGVTVNCVAPGPFLTEMPLSKLPPAAIEAFGERVPLRRWGKPSELVGPVLMLVSEAGAYVNGATLRVDGGLLARAY